MNIEFEIFISEFMLINLINILQNDYNFHFQNFLHYF